MNDHSDNEAKATATDAGWMIPGLLGPFGHRPDAEPEIVAPPKPVAPADPTEPPANDAP